MSNVSDIGDELRLGIAFAVGESLTDPTDVTVRIYTPSGAALTGSYTVGVGDDGGDLTVVRDSAGVFYTLFTPDEAGDWWHRWEGTGAVNAAEDERFVVRRSRFYPLPDES